VKPVPFSAQDVRDAAWTIVKDAGAMNATGHARAVRWARAYLDLDDTDSRNWEPQEPAPREPRPSGIAPWPDGINPHVTPERRAALVVER
jgi:hypothetical protein